MGFGDGTGTVRHAAEDGAGDVVDEADAVVDAEPLAAALVDALWLALLPQPTATSATATIRQARRTAPKQTRSVHRELLRLSVVWPAAPAPLPLTLQLSLPPTGPPPTRTPVPTAVDPPVQA